MIGFALRHWKLLLDCLIVVVAILAFTYWDPFKIFNTAKLRNTAMMVTGVREIGELVTAEYYGEVISSWKQFKLTTYPEDTVRDFADEVFIEMKTRLSTGKEAEARASFMKYKAALKREEQSTYDKFMAFLGTRYLNKRLKKIYDKEKLDEKLEQRILSKVMKEVRNYYEKLEKKLKKSNRTDDLADEYSDYLDSIPPFLDEFYPFYSMLTHKDVESGPNKRKNIVFIGRGWVKAGFRFNKFDENNFFYDRANKVIHFYGLHPEILDKDINPWFIPQRNVKGFELVNYSGDVNFQDAKEVKKQCKELLLAQAGMEILKKAQENGEEVLRNFFSLLLDEPDLQVEFHPVLYQDLYAHIAADTLVTLNEALTIDTLYRNEITRLENNRVSSEARERGYQFLEAFIQKLKDLHFLHKPFHFSYYSLAAARMLSDTFHLAGKDFEMLFSLRGKLSVNPVDSTLTTEVVSKNPVWFTSGDFVSEFNSMVNMLMKESISMEKMLKETTGSPKFTFTGTRWNYDDKPIVVLDTVRGRIRFVDAALVRSDKATSNAFSRKGAHWKYNNKPVFLLDSVMNPSGITRRFVDTTQVQADASGSEKFLQVSTTWSYEQKPVVIWDTVSSLSTSKILFWSEADLIHSKRYPLDYAYDIQSRADTTTAQALVDHQGARNVYNPELKAIRDREDHLILKVQQRARTRDKTLSPIKSFTDRIRKLKTTLVSK